MEKALSNPRDGPSAQTDPNVASAPSATLLHAQRSSVSSVPGKPAANTASQMVSTSPSAAHPAANSSETNNNLKIFKSEYDTKPVATMKQNNGVEEQGQQLRADKSQHLSSSSSIASHRSDSEINLDTPGAAAEQPRESARANPQVDEVSASTATTTTPSIDQSRSDSERQLQQLEQQQVPSPAANKLLANNRSILILREIQPDTPEGSVREIFNSENCPSRPVHCEYALHNSWYVTFSNDEDAKLALAYIRKHIVRWQGKPIMARYKPRPAVPSSGPGESQLPMGQAHHHNHNHLNHHHQHHNQHEHQIVPSMVMQQQEQQSHHHQGAAPDDSVDPSISSSGFLNAGVPSSSSAAASIVDGGDTTPGHHEQLQQSSPMLMSPTGGPVSHNGHPGLMAAPYGALHSQHASPSPHHHHPDGSLLHHPHHHLAQMMAPHHHHQHPHDTLAADYGGPYYDQHGNLVQQAPWDLSSVFIYNGLSPYNKTSVSSVAFPGDAYQHIPPHQHQTHQSNQHQPQHPQHTPKHPQHYPHNQRHHQRQHASYNQGHAHNHSGHQRTANNGGPGQQTYDNTNHRHHNSNHGTKSSRKNHNKQGNK